MEPNDADLLIPTIHLHRTSVGSYKIFNPNNWNNKQSKAIIDSCASEHSTLRYAIVRLDALCKNISPLWKPSFENLQKMWAQSRWRNHLLVHLVQVPELHVLIEFFLSGVKTLLDLIVQLVRSEQVINADVHGYHEEGRRLLRSLQRNVVRGRHQDADDQRNNFAA